MDWNKAKFIAFNQTKSAYAPFSGLKVGAYAETNSGNSYAACNVENPSFGLTLCAECGIISKIVSDRDQTNIFDIKITYLVAVDQYGNYLAPCGRCRQLLIEWSTEDAEIMLESGVHKIHSLLPESFSLQILKINRDKIYELGSEESPPKKNGSIAGKQIFANGNAVLDGDKSRVLTSTIKDAHIITQGGANILDSAEVDRAYDEEFDKGFNEGYLQGRADGHKDGYDQGVTDGILKFVEAFVED